MTAAQMAELHARLDALDLAAFALRHELDAINAPRRGDDPTNSNVSRSTKPELERSEVSTA